MKPVNLTGITWRHACVVAVALATTALVGCKAPNAPADDTTVAASDTGGSLKGDFAATTCASHRSS